MPKTEHNQDKRLNIFIGGRVQGVSFRTSIKRVADQNGLVGFVRNLPDGRVEIMAQGKKSGLRALLYYCYRGSLLSSVENLSFTWLEEIGEFSQFSIDRYEKGFMLDQISAFTNLGKKILGKTEMIQIPPVKNTSAGGPKHVVIIPDGNRRWAKERGLPVWKGHQAGMERTKELVKAAGSHGISHMTFWGFSTENWSRPTEEIDWIMKAVAQGLKEFGKELIQNSTRFKHLVRKDRLPEELLREIVDLENKTNKFTDKHLALAIDYGGRDEILRAVKKVSQGAVPASEESISAALDTGGFPDPDLIIRTSGEQRTSGIMPWQGIYSELYFSPVHYPDFDKVEFAHALDEYASRDRRFGSS